MIDLPPTPYVIVCNVGENVALVALGVREHPPTVSFGGSLIPPHAWMAFPRDQNTIVDFIGSPIKVRGELQIPTASFQGCDEPG